VSPSAVGNSKGGAFAPISIVMVLFTPRRVGGRQCPQAPRTDWLLPPGAARLHTMLDLPVSDYAPRLALDDRRGHVESYFLKANSAGGNRALWIRHTVRVPTDRPDEAVAEVWAIAFHRDNKRFPVAIKSTIPLRDAALRPTPFRFEHDAGVLEIGRARGELRTRDHSIGWSLEFDATGPTHYPYPVASMYTGAFPRTKSLTPVPDTSIYGAVEVDGHRWVLSGWRGMQGHNWGPEHTGHYAWIHCNVFEDGTEGFIEGMS